MSSINANKGAFQYPGSKGKLSSWIIEHIPEHSCYVEPFGGSAATLLQKPESDVEILNDRDGDIVHFFTTLRDRRDELIEWLECTPFSRDLHRKYGKQYYAGYRPECDVERAGRWFYLRSTQFAQKYTGFSGFASASSRNVSESYHNRVQCLVQIAERLRNVQIDNRDYVNILARYDAPNTVFYLDPPYVDAGDALYSHNQFDHQLFANELHDVDAHWICSYTELPEGLAEGCHVVEKECRGTMRAGQEEWEQENTERLVMNFDPNETTMFVDQNTKQETLASCVD